MHLGLELAAGMLYMLLSLTFLMLDSTQLQSVGHRAFRIHGLPGWQHDAESCPVPVEAECKRSWPKAYPLTHLQQLKPYAASWIPAHPASVEGL